MFTVYSTTDNVTKCIHDDLVADPRLKLLDPKLDLSDSAAGSFSFKLAPNNIAYGTITQVESTVSKIENDGAPVDIAPDLQSGNINQNGEIITDDTSVYSPEYQKGTSTGVFQHITDGSVVYTSNPFSQGIELGSGNIASAFSDAQIANDGTWYTGSTRSKARVSLINFIPLSNPQNTETITYQRSVMVVAKRKSDPSKLLRYQCWLYTGGTEGIKSKSYTAVTNCGTWRDIGLSADVHYIRVSIYSEDSNIELSTSDLDEAHVYLKVTKTETGQSPVETITEYYYEKSINYGGVIYRGCTDADCLHPTSKLQVTGQSARIYYRFELNDLSVTESLEQGGVIEDNKKISLVNTTEQIRVYSDVFKRFINNPYVIRPNVRVKVTTTTDKDSMIRCRLYYATSNADGADCRDKSDLTVNSEMVKLTTSYFGQNMLTWIALSYSDGEDITPNDIASIEFEILFDDAYYLGGNILLYKYENDDYIYMGSPGAIEIKNKQGYCDVVTMTNGEQADYISMNLRLFPVNSISGTYPNPLTPSDFNSVEFATTVPFQYTVHQYNDQGYVGSIGPQREGGVSFSAQCTRYRITISKEDQSTLDVQNVGTASKQMLKTDIQEKTKEIDLVGRLTSTITIKRSCWGTSWTSNGEFNIVSPMTLTAKKDDESTDPAMEQGWYRIGNGINGEPKNSDIAIRTTGIIPIGTDQDGNPLELGTSDYISVYASIRGTGEVDVKTPNDSDTGSAYRRPCGYVLYFYNNDTCLGVLGDESNPIASNSDIQVPHEHVTGIKVCIRPIAENGKDYLYIDDLDHVKIYTTKSLLKPVDISGETGAEIESEYTVTTSMIRLKYEVNTATNTWSAQIDGQARDTSAGLVWGVAMYNASYEYLGMQRWLEQSERFDGLLQGTRYIRIIIKYRGILSDPYGIQIAPNDISVLNVTCKRISNTRTEDTIWEGRVLSEDGDFRNCRTIYCEGDLAYLNDTRQPPRVFENTTFKNYIQKLIEIHNSKVAANRRFSVGNIWEPTKKKSDEYNQGSQDEEDIHRHVTNFETTLELINQLVNDFGGHIRIRRESNVKYIDWLENYPKKSNQIIRFGKNLLDFTKKYDMSKLCTAVYPTGNVIVEAKSSAVGDHVSTASGVWTRYENTLMYAGDDGKAYRQGNCGGYLTVCATVEPATADKPKSYYFSGRLHGGFVAYWITDDGNNTYYGGLERAGDENPETGFVDYLDKEIQMPPGANKIWMCSFGSAIPLALKNQIKETTGVDELLTITDVNTDKDSNGKVWHTKGSPYISNPEAVEKYGWIEHRLDLSNIKDKNALYNSAKNYIKNSQFEEMNLEVSVIDLNSLGVDAEYIDLLDEVRVVSEPHGLDKYFPVTSMSIPLNDPANQKYTLGTKNEVTLSGQHASSNTELLQKIEAAPSGESVLRTAFASAASAIATATSGSFINYVYTDEGHMAELVVSDAPPSTPGDMHTIPETANVWRWNYQGLAHSSRGYDFADDPDALNLALTANGEVLANAIIGNYILGLAVSGSYLHVGSNPPTTGDALKSIMPHAGQTPLSAITVRDGSQQGSGAYTDLCNGALRFGMLNNGQRAEYGYIKTMTIGQTGGGTHDGLVIGGRSSSSQGLLVINAYDVGVGKGVVNESGEVQLENVTTAVGSNGPDVTLTADTLYSITVRNGMIIGYTERSNNSE